MCDEPRGRAPVALNAASVSEQRVRSRKGKALVALNAAAKPYSTRCLATGKNEERLRKSSERLGKN